MKISFDKPPIYDEANELFHLNTLKLTPVFTYGDTIYNPSRLDIKPDLAVHEEKHAEQQKHNATVAKLWWKRYLADPAFREEQEAEAYSAQYQYLCTLTKDRNKRFQYLHALAVQLAGEMYGNVITYSKALKRISA